MVYLIICSKTNTCKIGYSTNPEARLAQLQTGNPFSLEIGQIIEGTITLEKELHNKFKEFKLQGEWFEYTQEIKDYFNVEEFVLLSPEVMELFMKMTGSEVNVFGFILHNTILNIPTSFEKEHRKKMSNTLNLHERTIYAVLKKLCADKTIIKSTTNLYYINPKFIG